MNPATTLKKLLKPPFFRNTSTCRDIYCKTQINPKHTGALEIDISGRASFTHFENSDQLWNELVEFVVQTLNEKWERDFGEPLRWITRYTGDVEYLKCPKCNWDDLDTNSETIHNYCPCCGRRLLPPEENKPS